MKKTFFSILLLTCASFATNLACSQGVSSLDFASGEHMTAGDEVVLTFSESKPTKKHTILHLPNGAKLTYGEIVAMGDFYGIPGHPISEGQSIKEREQLFTDAFSTFALSKDNLSELKQLVKLLHYEQSKVLDGMKDGKKPEDIYHEMADDNARMANCITGGGCGEMWWLNQGRYLQLARRNYDHFREHAIRAYQTGHRLAVRVAILAKKLDDPSQLEIAYAINAYASHFLSDRFAAGHIRTPREALQENVTPELVGSVLAAYMHYEEGPYGLHVKNKRGDHWVSYGDAYYFAPQNKLNRELLRETLQASADEIYKAYQSGVAPQASVNDLIPYAVQTNNMDGPDIAPLFYWNVREGNIYRRTETTNYFDHSWTAWWWGWSTLAKLNAERGLPTHVQGQLAASEDAGKALAAGLIRDKKIIAYIKSRHKN